MNNYNEIDDMGFVPRNEITDEETSNQNITARILKSYEHIPVFRRYMDSLVDDDSIESREFRFFTSFDSCRHSGMPPVGRV